MEISILEMNVMNMAITALPLLYLALSVWITLHILRHKKNPRSSLLWIALVWFAPLMGAILYFMFGINRITRRARRLGILDDTDIHFHGSGSSSQLGGEHWQSFYHLGFRVSGLPQTKNNSIEIIEGVDVAHEAFFEAIQNAKKSVLLASYIFKHDDVGKHLIQALTDAKKRGVAVFVCLDGVGNGIMKSGAYYALRRASINVQRFIHSYWPWRMSYLNLRNHSKLLIIDGHIGFTGSTNIGHVNNLETHFKIQGPIVDHMRRAFYEDWMMASKQRLPHMARMDDIDAPASCGTILARGIKSSPAYLRARTATMLSGALSVATKNIRIATPYFVPDQDLLSDLELASLRGVKIELFLPKRSNYRWVDWAGRRQLRPLLEAGCLVYFRSTVFDHSKLMVVDDRWALIGSSNWDARSLRLNFEFDIECEDEKFVALLNACIDKKRRASQLVEHQDYVNRSKLAVLRDSLARLFLPYL